ncbi:MAG TPA: 3' terminal RNA ribose 2'-O-methyltransferase Hen1 [Verrucomicrobiae bacterium]|nr:3' terminal RNA ribose 2'-O-methyltransferase Hen1 [Verrucomicrobiae bacterium]
MLLTLTTTHSPATDLGFLLRKNPARPQSFHLNFGRAHVFYPEATSEYCTVALLVELDPVALVRNRRGPRGEGGALEQYVNDRPYAASSFLSVAIAEVFGSALSGKSREKPELVETPMPFRVRFSALPCRGGEEFLKKLFEPLGYKVTARRLPLDEKFSDWGESAYHQVELETSLPLRILLTHLYVLVPVLDNDKHYWVGDDEVKKLLRHGEGWLSSHPERELIARRYLKHQRSLVDDALAQLAEESDLVADVEIRDAEEAALEATLGSRRRESGQTVLQSERDSVSRSSADQPMKLGNVSDSETRTSLRVADPRSVQGSSRRESAPTSPVPSENQSGLTSAATESETISLNEQRLGSVLAAMKAGGATRVLDLGCGEGRLLRALLKEKQFSEIVGMDVSHRALEIARDRLHFDRLPPVQKERIRLLHGSLIYRDERLAGFDAAAVVEVIEHLDAARLAAFERVLFDCAKPKTVVITTPNREYNVKWETLPAGKFRHRDHRFEWTRAEFQEWANRVAARFDYQVRFLPVGPEDAIVGSPTQMGVFERL